MTEKIDVLIKNYLENRKADVSGSRENAAYPSSEILVAYLLDKLDEAELKRMLDFLRKNPDAQELVTSAREAMEAEGGWENESVPRELVQRAQGLMRSKSGSGGACPHCGKTITSFKKPLSTQKWLNAFWVSLAVVSFAFSFAFPHYFVQFVAAALLSGIKGIVEMRATKTQILIYKALSEESGPEQHRLHQHSSRL